MKFSAQYSSHVSRMVINKFPILDEFVLKRRLSRLMNNSF